MLVRKSEEKRFLVKCRCKWEDNIKMTNKQGERVWARGIEFWKGSDGGLLEHESEFSCSTTRGKFLE
jgi:hypothetical protein